MRACASSGALPFIVGDSRAVGMAPADQAFAAWAAELRGGRTADVALRPYLFKLFERKQLTLDDL